jgi:hypothetical protein
MSGESRTIGSRSPYKHKSDMYLKDTCLKSR